MFELCQVTSTVFNLSHESLMSSVAQHLQDVQENEPDHWAELDQPQLETVAELSPDAPGVVEDPFQDEDPVEDDSNIPMDTVLRDIAGELAGPSFAKTVDRGLI